MSCQTRVPLIRSWGCSLNRSSSCSLTRRSSCPPTRPPAQGWDPPPLGRRSTSPPKGRCQILETCTGCAKVMIVEYRSILWHTFSSSKKWLLSGSGCWCGIGYLTQNWPKINNVIVKMMMIYILWCSVCLFVCHEKSSLPPGSYLWPPELPITTLYNSGLILMVLDWFFMVPFRFL